MSDGPCSGVSLSGLSGVWVAARGHGLVRNRRDRSAWPSSGKDRSYKPMVRSSGGQRESDGVVVPVIGVQHNAPGGKGPDFGHAGGGGKREGMAGTARSKHLGGRSLVGVDGSAPIDNVRKLQRKLWAAAKQSEGRRFHALYDRVHRGDVLAEAWRRVRANRGAAGVDRVTLEVVEEYGVQRMLAELSRDLRAGKFRQLDRHVAWRLKRLLIKKRGRNLRAGQAGCWTEAWFHDQGLHKLLATIRYPQAA